MKTIYVSPRGNDQWSGLLADPTTDGQDGPFARPERAVQVLRAARRTGEPAEVRLRGGAYYLSEPLVFGPELAGTESAPVRFSAYPGEQPVLSGGSKITNWQVGEHQGRCLWMADLPDVATGGWNFLQLFVNGQRRFRPRLPRTGFHRFAALTGKDSGMNWHQGPDDVQFEPGQIRNWRNIQDVDLVVYQLWFDTHHRIKSIDEDRHIVHFQARSLGSLKDEQNLHFQHAEWLPPADWTGSIQACFDIPGAIVFSHAEHCALYGCEVRRIAQYAVQLGAGSHDCRVVACAMSDMGAGGVRVDHEWCTNSWATNREVCQPNANSKPRAALVSDCVIHDGSVLYPSAIGIWIGNAGHNRILHNHIFNMNYTGISCGWTWGYADTATVGNRIEYNHIHHTRHAAYSCHYGRDMLVRNNIFAYSGAPHVLPAGRHEGHRVGVFEQNIIVFREGRMDGSGYAAQGWPRKICQFSDNLIWSHSKALDLGEPLGELQEQGQFLNTVVADPLFLDPDGGDFSLRSDSPALAMGFKPFAPEQAGPRRGGCRPGSYRDWPRESVAPRPIVTSRLEIDENHEVRLRMTNLGDARATGRVTLKPLEIGTVTLDGIATVEVAGLAPGATLEHRWRLQVGATVEGFGIETEVEGVGFLSTLAYHRLNAAWRVPTVAGVNEAVGVPAALAAMVPRQLRKGKKFHAAVRLGRTATHLLLALDIADVEIKPNPGQPWAGSCVEVSVASAQPAEPNLQFFLVPDPASCALSILRIAKGEIVPMAETDGVLRLEARGYSCAARIHLDQFPPQAEEMRFELRVIGRPVAGQPQTASSLFGCAFPAIGTADYGVIKFDA